MADPYASFSRVVEPDPYAAFSSLAQNQPQEIPSSGPGEPHRGKYVTQAEKERRYRMDNPQPASMFDMNPSGSPEMANKLVGLGESGLSMASGMVAMPIAGVVGAVTAPAGFAPGMEGVGARNVSRIQNALTYEPRTVAGQQASAVMSYPFEKLAQGGRWAGEKVQDATGSALLATAVDTAVQSTPALLARGKMRRGDTGVNSVVPRVAGSEEAQAAASIPKAGRNPGLEGVPGKAAEAPSLEDLRTLKDEAYKRADQSGITLNENSLKGLKVRIVTDLNKVGMNKTLHPDASAALKDILKSKGSLSLTELETLRQVASDAKGSIKPADSMRAAKIVDHIDNYLDNLSEKDVTSGDPAAATALSEARGYYSRLKKAETIKELIDRAQTSAPNFSGSGLENALRTEFRSLAKNANKIRRFTPEERSAIKKVARGGPMGNILRQVGKLAPTGVVSAALGPAAGFMAAGPTGAMIAPAIGFASRQAATRMTLRNANAAEQLMRRGPVNQIAKTPEPVAERRNYFAEKP